MTHNARGMNADRKGIIIIAEVFWRWKWYIERYLFECRQCWGIISLHSRSWENYRWPDNRSVGSRGSAGRPPPLALSLRGPLCAAAYSWHSQYSMPFDKYSLDYSRMIRMFSTYRQYSFVPNRAALFPDLYWDHFVESSAILPTHNFVVIKWIKLLRWSAPIPRREELWHKK